jgi:sulfofructose kinase
MVTGFGSAVLDVLMTTDKIVLQGKNPVTHQMLQIGGVIPTALVVLTRLGIKTDLYSIIGDDMIGSTLLTILKNENVGVTHVIKNSSMMTPLATVVLMGDTRTIFYSTADFSKQSNQHLAQTLSRNTSYLLIDGHNNRMSHEFIKRAHLNDTKVILDLGTPKTGLDNLLREVDTIIVPKAFWSILPQKDPKAIAVHLLKRGPSTVIITMEDKGCFVASKDEMFHHPSYTVPAIDTNGAGDVFLGSLTYGFVNKWPLTKTVQFASGAAALSCTKIGKDEKIPRSENEVFEFIKRQC